MNWICGETESILNRKSVFTLFLAERAKFDYETRIVFLQFSIGYWEILNYETQQKFFTKLLEGLSWQIRISCINSKHSKMCLLQWISTANLQCLWGWRWFWRGPLPRTTPRHTWSRRPRSCRSWWWARSSWGSPRRGASAPATTRRRTRCRRCWPSRRTAPGSAARTQSRTWSPRTARWKNIKYFYYS